MAFVCSKEPFWAGYQPLDFSLLKSWCLSPALVQDEVSALNSFHLRASAQAIPCLSQLSLLPILLWIPTSTLRWSQTPAGYPTAPCTLSLLPWPTLAPTDAILSHLLLYLQSVRSRRPGLAPDSSLCSPHTDLQVLPLDWKSHTSPWAPMWWMCVWEKEWGKRTLWGEKGVGDGLLDTSLLGWRGFYNNNPLSIFMVCGSVKGGSKEPQPPIQPPCFSCPLCFDHSSYNDLPAFHLILWSLLPSSLPLEPAPLTLQITGQVKP